MTHHLTAGHTKDWADRITRTYAGQASWAEETRTTCQSCAHWTNCGKPHPPTKGAKMCATPASRSCALYQKLMGHIGPAIPHDAPACRFHEWADHVRFNLVEKDSNNV